MEDLVAQLCLTAVCVILLSGVSTVGNICVILAFACRKHIRTVSNYFFLSLTFGDLLVGLCYPFQCLVDLGVVTQRLACLPVLAILLLVGFIVIWSLIALTVERYITITQPLTAGSIISEKRAVKIIGLIFIFAGICGGFIPVFLSIILTQPSPDGDDGAETRSCQFVTLVPSEGYRLFVLANRIVSIFVFIVVYVKVFFVVRRHKRAIAAVQAIATPAPVTSSASAAPPPLAPGEDAARAVPSLRTGIDVKAQWRRKVRSTALLFTIVLYHVLSWIPLTAGAAASETGGFLFQTFKHFVTYSSAAVNPMIYGLCNRKIRSAIIEILLRKKQRGERPV